MTHTPYTTETKTTNQGECPACSHTKGRQVRLHGRLLAQVFECAACGGLHGTCYKGDANDLVLPYFAPGELVNESERVRYFDLTTLGSAGVQRVHGWYDPATGYIVQVG